MQPTRSSRATALAEFIAGEARRIGMSEAEVCRAAHVGDQTIRNMRRGSMPAADVLPAIAKVLGVQADRLFSFLENTQGRGQSRNVSIETRNRVDEIVNGTPDTRVRDLPLRRQHSPKGPMDVSVDEDVTTIIRPVELSGRREAYGVYVADELNAPVIRVGHIAHVDPSRPVMPGHMVRVFPLGSDSFIGILESRDAKKVAIRVSSEPKPRLFDTDRISRIERVVGFSLLEA